MIKIVTVVVDLKLLIIKCVPSSMAAAVGGRMSIVQTNKGCIGQSHFH